MIVQAHAGRLRSAEVRVRGLLPSDLGTVAGIHMAAFPENALTRLGPEAVRRYYEWQLQGPHDVTALTAERGDECIGFCFGGVFRGAMTGFLRRNRLYLTVRVATHPWLLRSSLVRARLGTAIRLLNRSRRREGAGATAKPRQSVFGILAIAVDPRHQGVGAGKLLMLESEKAAMQQAFVTMSLSVDPGNEQAVRFYEELGWVRIAEDGRWSGQMQKGLSTEGVV